MKFGIEKIMDCFALALDWHKVAFAAAGLLLGVIGYCIFMFPLAQNFADQDNTALFFLCAALGEIWLLACVIPTYGGLARMFGQEMTGQGKISAWEALAFAKKNFWKLLFTPIVLILACAGVIAIELFVAWILSLIPVVGLSLAALLTLPYLLINLILALAFLFGANLCFAAIAVENSSLLQTIARVVNLFKAQPIKAVLFYTLALLFGLLFVYMIILFTAGGVLLAGVGILPVSLSIMGGSLVSIPSIIVGISLLIPAAALAAYLVCTLYAIHMAIFLALKDNG